MENYYFAIDKTGKVHRFLKKPKYNYEFEQWEDANKHRNHVFTVAIPKFPENEIYKLIKVSR